MALPEKRYENKIKKMLDKYGAWYVKYFANAFTPSGIPDILCCVRGRFVAIEVKASNGRPSPLQIHNLKKIDDQGGYAILAYPEDFEQLERLIKAMADNDQWEVMEHYAPFKNDLLIGINKFIKQD